MDKPKEAKEKPVKQQETERIKDKVEKVQEECYQWLKKKAGNDLKVLVSLALKLLVRAREEKKGE